MVIYFDNAATAPLAPEIRQELALAYEAGYANPSSLHQAGRKARKALNGARASIAAAIGADADEVFFTSGASESNNLVLKSFGYDLLITSPAEHSCVLEAAKSTGKKIHWLALNQQAEIDLAELKQVIEKNSAQTILVSLMHVNNETGTVQDIEAIGKLCKKYSRVFFHSDCVQSLTKIEIDLNELGLDAASFSAHKIHGPKGIGCLFLTKELQSRLKQHNSMLIHGGGQESMLRSGTENLVGAIAMAKSIELAKTKNNLAELQKLHGELESQLRAKIPGVIFNNPTSGVPGIFNLCFSHAKLQSEELVLRLDLAGVAVSSGSACSSNKGGEAFIQSSYVLRACKIADEISSRSIRISLSRYNTLEETNRVIQIIQKVLGLS